MLGKPSGTAYGFLTTDGPDQTRGRHIQTYWCRSFFFLLISRDKRLSLDHCRQMFRYGGRLWTHGNSRVKGQWQFNTENRETYSESQLVVSIHFPEKLSSEDEGITILQDVSSMNTNQSFFQNTNNSITSTINNRQKST